MPQGEVYKLKLENIAPGGDALGRIEGKPVFVQGGAPLESILCRITEDRETWARAQILEIIEASPVRVKEACAFYGKCGGCNLMHIDYNAQLEAKSSILKDLFERISGFTPPEIQVIPSVQFEYRNRTQFHCLRQKAKGNNYGFGFKGRSSDEIIEITDCPVAVPMIREIIKNSSRKDVKDTDKNSGIVLPVEKDRFTVFAKDDVLINEGGQKRGKINLLNKEITVDAGVFFQSNCFMLEKLILGLQDAAKNANHSLAMADLYSGVGTFALFLGSEFSKVILAEENKSAVSLARENLKGVNGEYYALRDSEWQRVFESPSGKKQSFGFIVADPPRTGLNSKLAGILAKDGPPIFAYVSCDAASLSRDSKILVKGGYTLKELKLYDFYPQTAHIESLAVFER